MDCDFTQLLIAFLLKFRRIDLEDIEVLNKMYTKNKKPSTNTNINSEIININTWLKTLAGSTAMEIINKMDLEVFILGKLKVLDKIYIDNLKYYFNANELNIIDEMIKKEYIRFVYTSERHYENPKYIKLLETGEVHFFYENNKEKIEEFKKVLESNNYQNSEEIIKEFLTSKNLDRNPEEILTIENFEEFGYTYGINIEKTPKPIIKRKTINNK